MTFSYDRIWLRLNERGLTVSDLREGTGLSSATVSKLRKNQPVNSTTLEKVCNFLQCSLSDITTQSMVSDSQQSLSETKNKVTHTVNSFFSGIGGFELGFESEDFETLFQCEIDKYCQSVLRKHWPEVCLHDDISTIDPSRLPEADVWVGGFPCQDVSVARGRAERLGLHGERSGLFYEFARLIEQKRPKVVLLENVAGLLNSNQGRDFGYILQRLTNLGYSLAWRVLNSRYFGVPQSRPRIYIVCWQGDTTSASLVLFEDEKVPTPKNQRHEFIEVGTQKGKFPITPKVSYCLAATSGRHTGTDWSRTYVVCSEGVRRMTPIEYERLQGFPDSWTALNERLDSDAADTLRYKAAGNAVSVPVIKWLASRIRSQFNEPAITASYQTADEIRVRVPSLTKATSLNAELSEIDFSDASMSWKWSNSGVAGKGYLWQATTPPAPAHPILCNLGDLVQKAPQEPRYYLTPNAAEGILRRCAAQGRTLFQPLELALRRLAES